MYHIILNGYWEPLEFELPIWPSESGWRRVLDTALAAPDDLLPFKETHLVPGTTYLTQPRSLVVLISG
jgi:glycogen operon protein